MSVKNVRQQFPPIVATKALWWYSWVHPGYEDMQKNWYKHIAT